jgi:hypothetical protein
VINSGFHKLVLASLAMAMPCAISAAQDGMPQEKTDDASVKTDTVSDTELLPVPDQIDLPPKPVVLKWPKIQKAEPTLPPTTTRLATEPRYGRKSIFVSADKTIIQLVGQIEQGVANRLAEELEANPNVKTLVLTSEGGLLIEGAGLAHLVRKYNLNTHVEILCASACTFPLLAGKIRSLSPGALVGFHQASTFISPILASGAQTADEPGSRMMQNVYAGAKLGQPFIDKALSTPPNDLWFPDTAMLQANAVITRIASPDEFPFALGSWASAGDFIRELNRDPLWIAAREGKPEHYRMALAAGWNAAASDKDKESSKRAAHNLLIRRLLSDARAYSDELLLEFAAQQFSIWDEMGYDQRKLDCEYSMAFRIPIAVSDDEAIKKQQLALYKKMIASPADLSLPDMATRTQAQAEMLSFWGVMVAEFNYTSFNVAANFCREPVGYYEQLAKMPEAERVKLLRSMFLMQSATIRG